MTDFNALMSAHSAIDELWMRHFKMGIVEAI
jgi:hypothetical protein